MLITAGGTSDSLLLTQNGGYLHESKKMDSHSTGSRAASRRAGRLQFQQQQRAGRRRYFQLRHRIFHGQYRRRYGGHRSFRLQRYTPISTTSTESDAVDLENYSLSQDTELVALQDNSLFYTADESGTTAASAEDLQAGSIVLVKWDADTGNAAEIILQNDWYTDAASVVSTTEGEVTVSLYQSDALSSNTLSSYDALDLSSSTLEETAQTLTAADDTRIYRYENGLLSSAALSDLSEGDTILVSYTSSASTTPSQIVLISATSSTAS